MVYDGGHAVVGMKAIDGLGRDQSSASRLVRKVLVVKSFAVYSAAKAYVLRFSDALHRELRKDGVVVTALCLGMSNTGLASTAKQKMIPALKMVIMQPKPVVHARIKALEAGCMSVVPRLSNKSDYSPDVGNPALAASADHRRRDGCIADQVGRASWELHPLIQ